MMSVATLMKQKKKYMPYLAEKTPLILQNRNDY